MRKQRAISALGRHLSEVICSFSLVQVVSWLPVLFWKFNFPLVSGNLPVSPVCFLPVWLTLPALILPTCSPLAREWVCVRARARAPACVYLHLVPVCLHLQPRKAASALCHDYLASQFFIYFDNFLYCVIAEDDLSYFDCCDLWFFFPIYKCILVLVLKLCLTLWPVTNGAVIWN